MAAENTYGFIVFRCNECGTRFLGPDKGEEDILIYDPAVCPCCGHTETKAFNLFELVRELRVKNTHNQ